jgi:hypothetical protein
MAMARTLAVIVVSAARTWPPAETAGDANA